MSAFQDIVSGEGYEKSPLISLLEGLASGYKGVQDKRLDNAKKLIELDQLRQEQEYQAQRREQIQQVATQTEANTQHGFKGVKLPVTPADPASRFKHKTSIDAKGNVSDTFEEVEPKQPDIVDSHEKALAEQYRAGKITLEQFGEMKKKGTAVSGPEGKMLPPNTILALNEGKSVARSLPDVERAIKKNWGKFGPVSGRVRGANPYDVEAQTFDAQMRTEAQAFGRFMEGGVLRKEDEIKYLKMFPTSKDDDQVKVNKYNIVRRKLHKKYEDDRKTLGASGYDVSGFEQLEIPPSIFDEPADGGDGGGASGMVKMSDGKETLMVPAADKMAAEKDGFKVVK